MRYPLLCVTLLAAAATASPAQERPLLIRNVTVIDGTGSAAQPGQSVLVEGGRISAIGPAVQVGTPAAARVIEGRGKFLIPGLWDMHTHITGRYGEKAFPLLVANGVTTVREMGSSVAAQALALRERARTTSEPAPRLFVAGTTLDAPWMIEGRGDTRWAVPTPEAGRAAVDSLATLGVDFIKVHSATPRAAYFAILEQAKLRGLFVAGHVPDSVSPLEAIRAGQRTIEHDWRIATAMSRDGDRISRDMLARMQAVLDAGTKSPLWPVVVERAGADSLAGERFDRATAQAFARAAADTAVWFDPTLLILRAWTRRYEAAVREPPELRFVPPEMRALDDMPPLKAHPTANDITVGRRSYDRVLATFRVLVRAGAKFVAGTDTPVLPMVPGYALQGELEQLAALGLSPLQVIAAATGNAAASLGKDGELGTIAPGKTADLVLLAANPLADIRNTRRIAAVILRGRLLDRVALDGLLARAAAEGARSR